ERGDVLLATGVPERDGGVPAKPPGVVLRYVQPVERPDELLPDGLEPLDEIDVAAALGCLVPPLLDAAVPRTDVLADVAPVDLRAERGTVVRGNRPGRLGPVRG